MFSSFSHMYTNATRTDSCHLCPISVRYPPELLFSDRSCCYCRWSWVQCLHSPVSSDCIWQLWVRPFRLPLHKRGRYRLPVGFQRDGIIIHPCWRQLRRVKLFHRWGRPGVSARVGGRYSRRHHRLGVSVREAGEGHMPSIPSNSATSTQLM